jgi:HTH-type transcriptional regulator / antitoxin HigA
MSATKGAPDRIRTPFAVLPGETVDERLRLRNMSQSELARRMDRPIKTINEIIKGKAAITPDTAIQLERVLGLSATFWNNLERNYREDVARIEERRQLAKQTSWLLQFPLNDLVKLGAPLRSFADSVDQLEELLRFFGVSSPAAWEKQSAATGALFRQSIVYAAHRPAVEAWLRWAEIDADRVQCEPFDEAVFRSALQQIRGLTREEPEVWYPKAIELCATAGVALVFIPELPKTRASGAAKWRSPTKAMIALSLYGKRADIMWFTFFHEAAHILFHGRRDQFVDDANDPGRGSQDQREEEANGFARDFLIAPTDYETIRQTHQNSKRVISRFASSIGVDAGIVVGRLQHDKFLAPNYCTELRRGINWAPPEPAGEAE